MKIFCFLTVRVNSSRLKNKCLLKFGSLNFLEHAIERSLKFKLTPIVCTSDQNEDLKLVNIAKKRKINFFRGSSKNKIKRWKDCAEHFKINKFHTIDVDDPLFDHKMIIKSVKLLKKYDYIKPSLLSQNGNGYDGYSFKTKILKKIINNQKLDDDKLNTENVEKILTKEKIYHFTNTSPNYKTKLNFRMTLDYKEDHKFLNILINKTGNFTGRNEINKFLNKNSFLRKINFFRNSEWKKRQVNQ